MPLARLAEADLEKKEQADFAPTSAEMLIMTKLPFEKFAFVAEKLLFQSVQTLFFVPTSVDIIKKKRLKTQNSLRMKREKVFRTSPKKQKWRECHTENTSKQWKGELYDKFR